MRQKLLFLFIGISIAMSGFSQVANQPTSLDICDNLGDDDGLALFDLTVKNAEILGAQNPAEFNVVYFFTQADAEISNDPVPDPAFFTNISNPQTLYVRVEEVSSGNYDITTLTIRTLPNPTPGTPFDLILCDSTNSGDDIEIFDLTANAAVIQNGEFNTVLTFHTSEAAALSGINIIQDASAFSNTSSPQTIFVRVENTITGCFTLANFDLIVNPLPPRVSVSDYLICGNTDGFAQFDLSSIDAEVLNGENSSDFTVTYHLTQVDADEVTNPLSSPFTNMTNPQMIFVAVTNNSTGCVSSGMSFTLQVLPSPQPNQPTSLAVCDPDEDGFAQFDLESKTAEILGGNDPVRYSIAYYETGFEAEAGVNPLASPYVNVIASSQTIYVRIEDTIFGCYVVVTLELQAINCSNVGQIVVDAFFDDNQNSIFDSDEDNFAEGYFTYEINNNGITYNVYSSTGRFILFTNDETDTYDITYNMYSSTDNCYSLPIPTIEDISVSTGNSVVVEFPVFTEDTCQDLGIFLYNSSASPRPGFNYSNRILLRNLGNEAVTSGNIEFLYDGLLQFNGVTSINPNYSVSTFSGGISIDFVNLMPNDVEDIIVSLYCPTSLTLGTIVTNITNYTTIDSDINSANNSSTLSQAVIGSYDPNDIIESHGPKIVYDTFTNSDEYLYYLIRFQNVGTAEAINIRIEDVLDAQLDVNTFEMLLSSHDNIVTKTGNEFIWQFDNINLPSESMDAEGSNGFVCFKIKPQAGYAIGDIIPNVADIYFDFNAAITTNVFNTEFVETLSVADFQSSNFTMYPNPASRSITLQFNSVLNGSITIFDIQGKPILKELFTNEHNVQLDVNIFESGLYFVKLDDGSNVTIRKLIVN